MITSKRIIDISERYVSRPNVGNDSVEIFVNPNSQELRDAAKDDFDRLCNGTIRFFADGDKKEVYVWGSRILHSNLGKMLGMSALLSLDHYSALLGVASVSGGRARIIDSYNLDYCFHNFNVMGLQHFFSLNWSWLYQYIDCKDYLNKRQDEFLRLKKK